MLSYKALLEDYGPQLGKKLRLDANLKLLERLGFITRRQDEIAEGPLLDMPLDYDVLAPRILDGALADVLLRERAEAKPETPEGEVIGKARPSNRHPTGSAGVPPAECFYINSCWR